MLFIRRMVKNEKQPKKTTKKGAINSTDTADIKPEVQLQVEPPIVEEPIKAKRGRKPKNPVVEPIVAVVVEPPKDVQVENGNVDIIIEDISDTKNVSEEAISVKDSDTKQVGKKRGRKPKGGKIIQHLIPVESQKIEKPNVILHLKCSIKDLQNTNGTNSFVDSYHFSNKHELNFDLITSDNIKTSNFSVIEKNNKDKEKSTFSKEVIDYDDDDEKEDTREVWKKLKQLEHDLHINNVNNKRSACFWDTCDFDNPPVYIPKHFINGTYHVYGCFCSPECAVAHLMNEPIDSSTKFERYHLLNHIYSKIYDYKKNIKPAPNPFYMLEKYYGNLSTQEYRSLLRNERLFLIVDKPLTRILPELHEDNDDFILNNKIIPSNSNYQVKTRMQKKKAPKTTIFNEKFSMSAEVTE